MFFTCPPLTSNPLTRTFRFAVIPNPNSFGPSFSLLKEFVLFPFSPCSECRVAPSVSQYHPFFSLYSGDCIFCPLPQNLCSPLFPASTTPLTFPSCSYMPNSRTFPNFSTFLRIPFFLNLSSPVSSDLLKQIDSAWPLSPARSQLQVFRCLICLLTLRLSFQQWFRKLLSLLSNPA